MTTPMVLRSVLAATLALPPTVASARDDGANTVWGEVPQTLKPQAAHVELQAPSGEVTAIGPIGKDGSFSFENLAPGSYYVVVNDLDRNGLAQSRVVVSDREAAHVALFDGLCGTGTTFVEGLAPDAMPERAREYGPNTIWGWAPGPVRPSKAPGGAATEAVSSGTLRAVLETTDGRQLDSVPLQRDGGFAFRNVVRGNYLVTILDPQRSESARSWEISFASGTSRMAVFAERCLPLALLASRTLSALPGGAVGTGAATTAATVVPATAAGLTGLIVAGAAAVGLGAVVIVDTRYSDPLPASVSR